MSVSAVLPCRSGIGLAALEITPSAANICVVLAVTEQESSYRADPAVPKLGQIVLGEIDRHAERLGIPAPAVPLALKLPSSSGKSYAERIDVARTEMELSLIFEDLIDRVPLGQRLFASWNPARTIAKRLDLGNGAIRQALEQGDSPAFERSTAYQRVFELADRLDRQPVPRAVLTSPKISRKLTTEWFANRVDERHRKCLARASTAATRVPI